MNQPGKFDLTIYQGDTAAFRVVLWADAERTEPTDLAGASVKSQIRDRAGGVIITELAVDVTLPNVIECRLTPEQTAGLPAGGMWDLQISWDAARVRTVLAGKVRVVADVTDSDLSRIAGVIA